MPIAATTFAADVVAATWLEGEWNPSRIDVLVARTAAETDHPPELVRTAMFIRAVRSEYLYEVPPKVAIEAQLQMLRAFAPIRAASLWTRNGEDATCVIRVGSDSASRRERSVARETVTMNDAITAERTHVHGFPIRRWDKAEGAIVIRTGGEGRSEAVALTSECAFAVAPFLEIENLLVRNALRERSLVESTDRRLTRLALDLHDGPMQDIAALAQDVRLYRDQLAPFLDGVVESGILLGRLDDVDARLLSMDSDLRELAQSLQAPAALETPLLELLKQDIDRFERQGDVRVSLHSSGDLRGLTSSQKIALLRVIREALNNVREHSGSPSAAIRIAGTDTHLTASVTDDGAGFDVEKRLIEAAQTGRLGLVGMSERVRLLDGRFDVESRPGGPTHVRVAIPRWRPLHPADR